ncbi:MAG: GIY-YIG nuclease family protein [Selenomonadaceae bacterium]|nr:GIY-YIG nuclease family protein [Selenomonadaceae bacterium]
MVTVYKITNRLNEKPYVGLTQQSIEKRFMQHSKANSPLGNAMRQCGLENFTIEVIERCETLEQAKKQERFWIRVLNSKVPHGYNQSDGGEGGYRKSVSNANANYRAKAYDRISIDVKKGKRDAYNAAAKNLDLSLSMLIQLGTEEYIRNHAGENLSVPADTSKTAPEKKLTAAERRLVETFARLPEKTRAKFAGLLENVADLADTKTDD